ncbi:xanthine dehydrogenase family protein molybdopterin-binding subunit [Tautonia plasticadhaerens]|uniref:Xanthine dehydrogenase molybdenum-binding subunit n=1 Tax=Tautonia plasticadhaerens TaxID=2527974 RepID=A0A518H1B1_9BACT|nr:xanthine dehydrogenase family protein molybdopterin-binding subunit [Tautonia plasticadhaerens]QDV34645.1 Xanthine dehydrogenase molybdenum-binding subunit [Tautonia plasticadhaerens]
MKAPETAYVGRPISRVDGRAKVTGAAKYAAEYNVPGLAHGYVISGAIARGKIRAIDAGEALKLDGVIEVLTHENRMRLPWFDRNYYDEVAPAGSPFRPLYDNTIQYSGQPIALVVAETFELARYAASLVRVEYDAEPHETSLEQHLDRAREPNTNKTGYIPPKSRGHAERALASAAFKVDETYTLPVEHHNPMEMFGSTAVWDGGGKITVYDKTQGSQNVRDYLMKVFKLSEGEIRVLSPFVGGAFGSGLRPQYQVFLAVLAAKQLGRSVRVTLTRQQMFSFGHRPAVVQRVALGAAPDGTLEAIIHTGTAETSRHEDYVENMVLWSGLLYRCDNVMLDHKVTQLDLPTPIDMRAPGAATGVFALESAMDELAVSLGMDPAELRLKNYADVDGSSGKPFSSKELRACYAQAAERFGWSRRNPEVGSMREGDALIGWGMASGVWEAQQGSAAARAVLTADGTLTVSSATADIGTGTYTVMTQLAAEALGLPIDDVTFLLGDSALPTSPVEGGSWTAATIGTAVHDACLAVRRRVLELARSVDGSPLAAASIDDVTFADGQVRLAHDPYRGVPIVEAMRQGKVDVIEEQVQAKPDSSKQKPFARYTHSAIFVEVKVDKDLGMALVPRVVIAVAAGTILNPKTAGSQVLGGVVMGIGMALEEESVLDHRLGRFMNHDYAEYHVPVHADVGPIDVIFVEEHDEVASPIGVKGLGEIGIVGVAAAVANAVYHATGRRIRDLPITPDKLL